MKIFLKQIIHYLRINFYYFKKSTKNYEFLSHAFLSIGGRWQGEINPLLTYIRLFDVLKKRKFNGLLLELGGGYSTVLLDYLFDDSKVKIISLDTNPSKYYRILNSKHNTNNFLKKINFISENSVNLDEVEFGFKKQFEILKKRKSISVNNALKKFASDQESYQTLRKLLNNDTKTAVKWFKSQKQYIEDMKFYRNHSKKNVQSFSKKNLSSNIEYNAIFFDCGEVSSIAEYYFLKNKISKNGYIVLHDIFFPKSIKNIFVAIDLYTNPDWNIIYIDDDTEQGGLVAQRLK